MSTYNGADVSIRIVCESAWRTFRRYCLFLNASIDPIDWRWIISDFIYDHWWYTCDLRCVAIVTILWKRCVALICCASKWSRQTENLFLWNSSSSKAEVSLFPTWKSLTETPKSPERMAFSGSDGHVQIPVNRINLNRFCGWGFIHSGYCCYRSWGARGRDTGTSWKVLSLF